MSRKIVAAIVALASIACADPGVVTSPKTAGSTAAFVNGPACSAAQGQQFLDAGDYKKAISEFTCLIDLDPTGIDGYRGRAEAEIMTGQFSDAVRDYARGVNSFVVPVHPDAKQLIVDGYKARLAAAPNAIPALAGLSLAYWWFFDYPAAIHVLDDLLAVEPNNVYGNLFRGSSRLLQGQARAAGAADLERAITLAPSSPDVRFVVADAYTYGSLPNAQRAFDEATFALGGGVDTPRIHAILGASYLAFGDMAAAAREIKIHLDQVTTQLVGSSPLGARSSATVGVVPGRTYEIPIVAAAGETISILATSKDFFDTILVLLAPNGTPVVGGDDFKGYFAGFQWVSPAAVTYRLRVTSFEAASTGQLTVSRN